MISEEARELFSGLAQLDEASRIDEINRIKVALSEHSPFAAEPVDCVQWVSADAVVANDYNPNKVAPPEMLLLEQSILSDGYTQPIVAHHDGSQYVVVDGFHRNRVGKESEEVRERVRGYLPVVGIRASQSDTENRMAATIRHNRARGQHGVEPMTGIVSYATGVINASRRSWGWTLTKC